MNHRAGGAALPMGGVAGTTEVWVRRLMEGVGERFGIQPTISTERKLRDILAAIPASELCGWVSDLSRQGAEHPDWQALVESLTVHETYFYRDKPLLWMIAGDILPSIIEEKRQRGDRRLRIWSAACSTGEEAYNLVMLAFQVLTAMGEAMERPDGVVTLGAGWSIDVLGTDLSSQVIRQAQSALYCDFGLGPFRDMPPDKRHFFKREEVDDPDIPGAHYFRVRDFVRRHARFRRYNLLGHLPPEMDFDLVLCRNVMIYFADDGKKICQNMLHGALRDGGALVMGGTDMQLFPERYERRYSDGGAWYVKKN